jgi:hypothetical protein
MPAAKGSARTPLGPTFQLDSFQIMYTLILDSLRPKKYLAQFNLLEKYVYGNEAGDYMN